jgi:hypothetical protein
MRRVEATRDLVRDRSEVGQPDALARRDVLDDR